MRPLSTPIAYAARLVVWGALVAGLAGAAHAQQRAMNSSLAGQLRMFQMRVVLGRIVASGPANRQTLTSNYMGPQRREMLSIDLGEGSPDVKFERNAPEERISYQVLGGNKVVVQQIPRSTQEQPEVVFQQPEAGTVTLTVTRDNKAVTYHAPTLWQLLVIEPEACREHLVPLLQIMRPNWQLAQQAEDIEGALCQGNFSAQEHDRPAWLASIAELGSPRFAVRERAEQQLRSAGPLVVPFLQTFDRSGLDAEQVYRVKRILRGFSGDSGEDTPERVAAWLIDDPRVWYALMERDSLEVRQLAAEKLARLLGTAVEFDAAAAPTERARQIVRLRERFADKLDPPAPASELKPQ